MHRPSAKHLPARRGGALLGLVVLLLGCQEPPQTIERVERRLTAASFPKAPTPRHGPVAQIGDEARTVVYAPKEVLAAEAFGVAPAAGKARAEIYLPPEVAALPDTAFQLTVQELPIATPLAEEVMAQVARKNFSLRRDRGWRLLRHDGSPPILELNHEGKEAVQLNLRLTALLPVPAELTSAPFGLPAGATLVLGFGLTNVRASGPIDAVEFVATLECDGRDPQELVRHSVSLADDHASTWKDVSVSTPPADACRLRLANTGTDGQAPRGAVWAAPQILAPAPATGRDVNVILISLDTLRSDHLSGLGYGRETSPTMDAEMMARGATFTDVSSTFPQTDVSHLSIFTGLYPAAQPTRGRVSPEDRLALLAEILQNAGWETAAFTENALVSGAFGFWFGFDQFTERAFAHADRGQQTFDAGIRYLETHRDRRFFLFLHTYKTHDPYVPGPDYEALWSDEGAWEDGGPAPWIQARHRDIFDRYDRTIREADDLVGRLLARLDELGLAGRTLIVVTSDHGEAFGEHGITGHGFTPHQEALDVPLLLRGPGVPAGLRIDTPVSIADLTPTLLELLDLPPTAQAQGVSLAGALKGADLEAARPLFFSWLAPEATGVRTRQTKYHRTARGHERFDLADDPYEWKPDRGDAAQTDGDRLFAAHESEAARLRRELGPPENEGDTKRTQAIDERLQRSLEALGYLD